LQAWLFRLELTHDLFLFRAKLCQAIGLDQGSRQWLCWMFGD
jgi:hypothetical protein